MPKITFLPSGKSIETEDTILNAARFLGLAIKSSCGGQGTCFGCKVRIDGNVASSSPSKNGYYLACQTKPLGDIQVHLEIIGKSKILVAKDTKLDVKNPVSDNYGIAVDLGTTTVVASLIDLKNGEVIETISDYNAQTTFGDDVLSRILHAKKKLDDLKNASRNTISELVKKLTEKHNKKPVTHIVIAGNTTMIYLLLGKNPDVIRKEDFPENNFSPVKASDIGLDINAEVFFVSGISAYVGGDITADIIGTDIHNSENTVLLVDVGTNGEIVLGNRNWMMACSASAGPAFEGGETNAGVRAVEGAIELLEFNDGFNITTIGQKQPIGICGSGFIDLIAELFKNKLIDKSGNLNDSKFVADGSIFVTEKISVTQDEIKNIIRSKAAIYASINTLINKAEITMKDVSKIIICGGFGHYLDIGKAKLIGLFPDVDDNLFEFAGNAAVTGAIKMLLDKKLLNDSRQISDKVTYVNLSNDQNFMNEYTASLFLPHTDIDKFRNSMQKAGLI